MSIKNIQYNPYYIEIPVYLTNRNMTFANVYVSQQMQDQIKRQRAMNDTREKKSRKPQRENLLQNLRSYERSVV